MLFGLFEDTEEKVKYDATGRMKRTWEKDDELFEKGYKFVRKWEGGYSNDVDDPGGETFNGLSKKYNSNINKTTTEIEKRNHYKKKYWEETNANKIDKRFAPIVFDLSTNPGTSGGVKVFQRALKIKDDGVIGSKTIEASKKADYNLTINNIIKKRKEYYDDVIKENPKKEKYKNGWYNRADDIKSFF